MTSQDGNHTPGWVSRIPNRMHIVGKPCYNLSMQEIIARLIQAPRGIKERTNFFHTINYDRTELEIEADKLFVFFKGNWQFTHNEHQEKTIKAYVKAARQYAAHGQVIEASYCFFKAGDACRNRLGLFNSKGRMNSEVAASLFKKSIKVLDANQHFDRIYKSQEMLYGALCATILALRENNKNQKADYYYERLQPLRQEIADNFVRMQGRIDKTAYRVEQGQIGFSNYEKFGTDNVAECMVVILHDPASKVTGLAHIDHYTNTMSLDKLFKRMPAQRLQARLFGTRYNNTSSNYNLERVINFLRSKNINVISADICDSKGPAALVVNPADFSIEEAVPYYYGSDMKLSNAIHSFIGEDKKLHMTFELMRSKEVRPVLLPRLATKRLFELIKYSNDAVAFNTQLLVMGIKDKALAAYNIMALVDEYNLHLSTLGTTLISKINQLEASGIGISEGVKERAMGIVQHTPALRWLESNCRKPAVD